MVSELSDQCTLQQTGI